PVMVHNPGTSSPQAARVAPAPSRSRLVVDRVERGAWCGIARWPCHLSDLLAPFRLRGSARLVW
ncbi:MAG: hypothetical protein ACK6EB_08830, partial [Planctomyces sp.]